MQIQTGEQRSPVLTVYIKFRLSQFHNSYRIGGFPLTKCRKRQITDPVDDGVLARMIVTADNAVHNAAFLKDPADQRIV